MRQLSKTQNILFLTGGALMVIAVGLFVFGIQPKAVSIMFLCGSVLFAAMQMMQTYEGTNVAIHRLRTIMVIGDVCFILSGLLMVETAWRVLYRYMAWGESGLVNIEGHLNYMKYVNNNWVVTLLIAAIIEMYTMHRISAELRKENNTEKTLKE